MPSFLVSWSIDIDDDVADTPLKAADAAYAIMRDPFSLASAFTVFDEAGEAWEVDTTDRTVEAHATNGST